MYFIFFLNNIIKKNIGESLSCNKWSSNDSTRAAGASFYWTVLVEQLWLKDCRFREISPGERKKFCVGVFLFF